jgi:hypothetical protein
MTPRSGQPRRPVAVGKWVTPPPGTKPGVRNYRTGLPPWMFDGKSILRPGVKDLRLGEPSCHAPIKALPCVAVLLATAAQSAEPEPSYFPPEVGERTEVGRNPVIGKIATHDGLEPSSLLLDWSVRSPLQFVLDIP